MTNEDQTLSRRGFLSTVLWAAGGVAVALWAVRAGFWPHGSGPSPTTNDPPRVATRRNVQPLTRDALYEPHDLAG